MTSRLVSEWAAILGVSSSAVSKWLGHPKAQPHVRVTEDELREALLSALSASQDSTT